MFCFSQADGAITITPVNVAAVYVPYYNPWAIWGTLFVAYPGYVLLPPPPGYVVGVGLAFAPPVAVGVYASGFDWGFSAWAPAWGVGTINYAGNTYISNSVTVINHGRFGYRDRDAFARGGRGVPRGFHGFAHAGAAREAGHRAGFEHGRLGARRHDTGHLDHGRTGRPEGHHDPVSRTGYHGPSGKPLPGHSNPSKPTPSKPSPSKPTTGHGPTSGKPTGSHPTPGTNHNGYGSGHATPTGSGNHGTTTTKRSSAPNRSTSATNRTSNPNRSASANHATPAANHSANGGHAAAPAGHTAANLGHSAPAGGGHAAAPSKGRGR